MVIKSAIAFVILCGLGIGVYVIAGLEAPRTEEINTTLVQTEGPVTIPATQLATIPTREFEAQASGRTVIDVRTGEEYETGHLAEATLLDFYAPDFRAQLEALPRDDAYAIYCRSGNRSGQTLAIMREMGFANVIDLQGGLVAWQADGRTTCTSC